MYLIQQENSKIKITPLEITLMFSTSPKNVFLICKLCFSVQFIVYMFRNLHEYYTAFNNMERVIYCLISCNLSLPFKSYRLK